jgi:DNA-binding transcriptional ArsR family regulator
MQSAVSPDEAYAPTGTSLSVEPAAVFAALNNDGCRALLAAIGDDALTAQELGEQVDIPLSTIYRHLDLLTETGFLEETVRINPHGRNENQYSRAFADLTVSLGNDFSVSVV